MNLRRFRTGAIGAILFGAAACVDINEELGKNFIPADLVVMDINENVPIPVSLGRPFLATTGAQINVK